MFSTPVQKDIFVHTFIHGSIYLWYAYSNDRQNKRSLCKFPVRFYVINIIVI